MNQKTHLPFALFIAFAILLAACNSEERKEYYDSGELKSITTYRDSLRDGKYISYYENGTKKEEGRYKDDECDGLWKSWHENGQLRKIVDYKDGKMYASKSWHENGRMSETQEFKKGLFTGLWRSWYKNGIVATEINYNNCLEDCIEKRWLENGEFFMEYHISSSNVYSK